MGFAFLPIGIGSLVGGWLGGRLMHYYGEVAHRPAQVWWAVTGMGIRNHAFDVALPFRCEDGFTLLGRLSSRKDGFLPFT